ncbi:hypothetical protein [Flavobacterium sp.]|uniref:hypothetical protein n=1 Tax=Flavobacterium sp. TaxID=239 RepID=UPI0026175F2B|nr:hypothetical protein [Flavobacterium sp.]
MENVTYEQLNDFIWYDDKNNNHYFTFIENGLIGVKDCNQKIILQPNYINILETDVFRTEIGGWGQRPGKPFLILLNQKKAWGGYHIKNDTFLDKTFIRIKEVNGTFYFIDEENNIYELDYYTEDFIPAKYDGIDHAFRHQELNKTFDVCFLNYIEKYPDIFITKYTDSVEEKQAIKSICDNTFESSFSFENPFIIFDHIQDLIEDEEFKEEALLLLKYIDRILSPKVCDKNVKYHKNYKKLWLNTQKLIDELVI